nr:MAG TPA: hypothetical protein [Caudoviricetes sp.]
MECMRYACGFCFSTKSPLPTDWYPATNTTVTIPTAKC